MSATTLESSIITPVEPKIVVVPEMPSKFAQTDAGNGELFAALHGVNVRFDHLQQRWLLWDEQAKRWIEDKQNQVRVLMQETARQRQAKAVKMEESRDRASEISWAKRSESRPLIDAAL